MYLAPLLLSALVVQSGPERPPNLVEGQLDLGDRQVPGFVDTRDLGGDVRFAPAFAGGAFWSFGDALRRQLWVGCDGPAPTLEDGTLSCDGPVRLRPDVTLPADPSVHPNSNVPPVAPGGRPVSQSLHFIVPWLLPCGVALLVFIGLAIGLRRLGVRRGLGPIEAPRPPPDRTTWLIIGGVTLLGLALRLVGLGDEPLEQNEFTYVMSSLGHDDPLGVILDINAMAQTHPPLPHLISWLFGRAGNSEFIARLPSALAATATLPLLMLLGWRLFQNRWSLLAIGLLAAVAPVHVWYGQDASPYALTAFFAVLALYGTDRVLADPTRRRGWWTLTLATWGLVYTHYYGLHLAFGCYLALLLAAWSRRSSGLGLVTVGSGFATLAGIVPWIPAFVQAYLWSRGHSTAYQRLAGVYHPEANFGFDLLDTLRLVAGIPLSWRWLAPAGVALFIAHLPLRALAGRRAMFLMPLGWFIPFELLNRATFLHDLYGGYYFGIRYFLFLFPVAWLLAGACVQQALDGGWRRWPTLLLLGVVLVGSTLETGRWLTEPQKPDVRGAAQLVRKGLGDGDAVIVGPAVFYQHPFHYYLPPAEQRAGLRINDFMQTPAWHALPPAGDPGAASTGGWVGVLSDLYEPYERTLQSHHIRRVFLVDHEQHLFDRPEFSGRPSAALRALLERHFELTWSRELHDASVRLYVRRTDDPGTLPLPEQLHFGWSDGPFVRFMEPSWAYASPGRRVERGAEVFLPAPKEGRISRLTLRMGTMPGGGHQARDEGPPEPANLRLLINGAPLSQLVVDGRYREYPIEVPPEIRGAIRLTFDRQRPREGSTRPPSIVLDWLRVDTSP